MHEKINLGGKEVTVYAQRWAYLQNRLGRTLTDFVASGSELTSAGFVSFLGGGAYDLLATLIPKLGDYVPKWRFMGYASQDAMDAGDYREDADESPSFPEIVGAFETVVRVNRFDLFKEIKQLVDPQSADLLKKKIRLEVAKAISSSESSQA